MTVPFLKQEEFITLLKLNGWTVENDKHWEKYNTIIFKKNEQQFILPLEKSYLFPYVVRTCNDLGIPPPAEHLTCYQQFQELQNRNDRPN